MALKEFFKNCRYCNSNYNCRDLYDYKKRKYCSVDCSNKARKGICFSPKTTFKKNMKPYNSKIYKKCIGCSITYHPCHSKQKYCSKKCFVSNVFKGVSKPMETSIKRIKTLKSKDPFYGTKSSLNAKLRKNVFAKKWRSAVFERDNYTCQNCNKRGVYLEAHHITPVKKLIESNNLNEIYNIMNGMTLCRICHMKKHNWEVKTEC